MVQAIALPVPAAIRRLRLACGELGRVHELVSSPDGATLYVLNSGMGDVAVVDLKTMALKARHKAGTDPFGGGIRVTR